MIGLVETAGPSGWLGASDATLTVPAGTVNTAGFDIEFDLTGVTEPVWLDGEMYLLSDAANYDSLSIPIHVLAAPHVVTPMWDTVATDGGMYDPYGVPEGDCVGLAVSNIGEIGYRGEGGANLDFYWSDNECGSRLADRIYLYSGSPYVIHPDGAGPEMLLTCGYADLVGFGATSWVATDVNGMLQEGVSGDETYDSVYTGRMVTVDTSVALERTYYALRGGSNVVVCKTEVFSADGQAHAGVTVGSVSDWNVPSEEVKINVSGLQFGLDRADVYMQGTDSTGVLSCQSNAKRFATEAFLGGYTWQDEQIGGNFISSDFHGALAYTIQLLGEPVDSWLSEIGSNPGLLADGTPEDQAIWLTYTYDYDLAADDTLYFWTAYATVRDGVVSDLDSKAEAGTLFMQSHVLGCNYGCCRYVGDANHSGQPQPTIGDISVIIDALFISGDCDIIPCLAEADINRSGGCDVTCGDITIGDISVLIDCLFIHGDDCWPIPCLCCPFE
jgi:hypothetical protein